MSTLEVSDTHRDHQRMTHGAGEIDFSGSWPRRPLAELIQQYSSLDISASTDADQLRSALSKAKIEFDGAEKMGRGALIDELYKRTVRPRISQPTFVDFPGMCQPCNLTPSDATGKISSNASPTCSGVPRNERSGTNSN